MRYTLWYAAAAALPVLVAGCTAVSSGPAAATAAATAASSADVSPTAVSSAAAPAGDALAGMTADQIGSKAVSDLASASSVHVVGTYSGGAEQLNVIAGGSKCPGTITLKGSPATTVVANGSTLWVKLPGGNEYVQTTMTNSEYASFAELCDPSKVAALVPPALGLAKGATTTIDGQQVLELNGAGNAYMDYVSETSPPELLRADLSGQGELNFSDYNAPVTITPPPASEIISST
jgi:outer membrane lipoprotein-sorting protein